MSAHKYIFGDDDTVKEITPRAIRQHLKAGAHQPTFPTRRALKELAGIDSIEDLLRSPNAGIAGKG